METENSLCSTCKKIVHDEDEAITCDDCGFWNHRRCKTGISKRDYLKVVNGHKEISFTCKPCKIKELSVCGQIRRDPVFEPPIEELNALALNVDDDYLPPPPPELLMPIPEDDCYTPPPPPPYIESTEYYEQDSDFIPPPPPTPTLENDDVFLSDKDDSRSDPFAELREEMTLDSSFNIPASQPDDGDLSFEPQERSFDIDDPNQYSEYMTEEPVSYHIIEKGSTRGGNLLVTSDGYSYTVKAQNSKNIKWRCSVRGKNLTCPATVSQDGQCFIPGKQCHNHPAEPGLLTKVEIRRKVKDNATKNIFRSASDIVEEQLRKVDPKKPNPPKQDNLERAANRFRQKIRPEEPKDLLFDVNIDFIGGDFYQGEVCVGKEKHVLFATSTQINILRRARRWFIDGTFRVVSKPFVQLCSIHAFATKDGAAKQIPLFFILMSRRTKDDYIGVFEKIKSILGSSAEVENVVLDYEKAAWLAVRDVFPEATIKGCVFHLTQAVWRKVQDLGLRPAYLEKGGLYNYCRKLMALPFLPHGQIDGAFENLKSMANTKELQSLCAYFENTWMDSTVWSIRSWSIYRRTVRTNNDVEGWHRRLNKRAVKSSLPFYMLVPLLKEEAELVDIQVALINDGLLRRRHRSGYMRMNKTIHELWDHLDQNMITTSNFLRECAQMFGPTDEE